jgi:hypothetical protein
MDRGKVSIDGPGKERKEGRRTEGVKSLLDVSGKLRALDELVLELDGLLSGRDLAGKEVPEHALREHLLSAGGGGEDLLALRDAARGVRVSMRLERRKREKREERRKRRKRTKNGSKTHERPQKRIPSSESRTEGSQSMHLTPRIPPKSCSTVTVPICLWPCSLLICLARA